MHAAALQRLFRCALLSTLLLANPSPADQPLQLTFSRTPHSNYTFSTRATLSVAAVDGKKLVLQRTSGDRYRLSGANNNWTWFQVEQVPVRETHIAVTPYLENDLVTLEIEYVEVNGDDSRVLSTTVRGELGNWIAALESGGMPANPDNKRYASASARENLYIKVEAP